MVVLAFIMTHLITYNKLPFSSGYRFPILPFVIFIIYGIFICETNAWNYRRLIQPGKFDKGVVFKIFRVNLTFCLIIFCSLTFIQMLVFQFVMNPFRFVGLLSVCLMISIIETGFFLFHGIHLHRKEPLTLRKVAEQSEHLTILRNDEIIPFAENEIGYVMQQNGYVYLVDRQGKHFTTQFASLVEVENRLSGDFFRATRQAIVSKRSVVSIRKGVNGKLNVRLFNLEEPLVISRYKSKYFKEWYQRHDH